MFLFFFCVERCACVPVGRPCPTNPRPGCQLIRPLMGFRVTTGLKNKISKTNQHHFILSQYLVAVVKWKLTENFSFLVFLYFTAKQELIFILSQYLVAVVKWKLTGNFSFLVFLYFTAKQELNRDGKNSCCCFMGKVISKCDFKHDGAAIKLYLT